MAPDQIQMQVVSAVYRKCFHAKGKSLVGALKQSRRERGFTVTNSGSHIQLSRGLQRWVSQGVPHRPLYLPSGFSNGLHALQGPVSPK